MSQQARLRKAGVTDGQVLIMLRVLGKVDQLPLPSDDEGLLQSRAGIALIFLQ